MTELVQAPKAADQQRAEADVDAFRRQLGPFVVAAETTRMAMVFTDACQAGNPIIFANASFHRLTGFTADDVLGQSLTTLLAVGAEPDAMREIEEAFESGCDTCPDVHFTRKDGGEFWASVFMSQVLDAGGQLIQWFVSFADLTNQMQNQAQCRSLIDELNHRVKNTLSTVQSIVSQALRHSPDQAIVNVIESRLLALSQAHDLLTSTKWEAVGLHDLIGRALEPFGAGDRRSGRFFIEGDDRRLNSKMTLALSIAFHELATNAVKYGALSNDHGTISVVWHTELVGGVSVCGSAGKKPEDRRSPRRIARGSDRGSLNAALATSSTARSSYCSKARASLARSMYLSRPHEREQASPRGSPPACR